MNLKGTTDARHRKLHPKHADRQLAFLLEASCFSLPVSVNWNAVEAEVVKPLLRAVHTLSETERERLLLDADRISTM